MALYAKRAALHDLGTCVEATTQSAVVLNWSLVAFLGLCDGVVIVSAVLAVIYRWRQAETPKSRMGFRSDSDGDSGDRY